VDQNLARARVGHRYLDNGEVTLTRLAVRPGDEMDLFAAARRLHLGHS
jgi:hypothetical protein